MQSTGTLTVKTRLRTVLQVDAAISCVQSLHISQLAHIIFHAGGSVFERLTVNKHIPIVQKLNVGSSKQQAGAVQKHDSISVG